MTEALRMVKTELGPDAMIISSTKEKRKGLLGFFLKPVFRVTATVGPPPRDAIRSARMRKNRKTPPGTSSADRCWSPLPAS